MSGFWTSKAKYLTIAGKIERFVYQDSNKKHAKSSVINKTAEFIILLQKYFSNTIII